MGLLDALGVVGKPFHFVKGEALVRQKDPIRFRLLRWIFATLVRLLARFTVEGLEYVPGKGPFLLVTNHLGLADIAVGYAVLGGADVTGWAAAKHRTHPIFGTLIRWGNGIFIRRGKVDREALEAAIAWLRQGKIFSLAPEGTRSRSGGLAQAKTGAAYLADLAQVPLLPAAFIGTENTFPQLLRFRRPEITFRIGKIFRLPPLHVETRTKDLRENTDEIMCHIAALLPPDYRGFYADHPRLKELLQEKQ